MQEIENKDLLNKIISLLEETREKAIRSFDFHRVQLNWHIGRYIFEDEQNGKERAEYGKYLVKYLSKNIEPLYGSSFSVRQLERFRQFYRTMPIAALRTQLNWTQYKILISLDSTDKREFYIAESIKNHWTSRQLERQINSGLYERLLLSNDKESDSL